MFKYTKLKSVPKLYAVIVKCDHNFLDFQSFDEISFVLVSDIEGGNFKPKTVKKSRVNTSKMKKEKRGF